MEDPAVDPTTAPAAAPTVPAIVPEPVETAAMAPVEASPSPAQAAAISPPPRAKTRPATKEPGKLATAARPEHRAGPPSRKKPAAAVARPTKRPPTRKTRRVKAQAIKAGSRIVATGRVADRVAAPRLAKRPERPTRPPATIAKVKVKPMSRAGAVAPVARKRNRPRRTVDARPISLTRILVDHLTQLVAEVIQVQRRMVMDELAALLT